MNSKFQKILSAAFADLVIAVPAKGATTFDIAQTINWSTAQSERLESLFKNKASVQQFVNTLAGIEEVPLTVGEYQWVDFNADGNLELVVTTDTSGREFYTGIFAFSMIFPGKIEYSEISTNGASLKDLAASIVDLSHDGRKELLVPRLMRQYAGARPVATFTDIYTFDNGRLIQSDQQFPDYYLNDRFT